MRVETYTGSGKPTQSRHFSRAESADGMYSYHHGMDGYVSVDCAMSGLEDNTRGAVGKHVIYLQHPGDTPEHILADARRFGQAVADLRRERESRDFAAYNRVAEEEKASPPKDSRYRNAEEAWEAEDEEAWARLSGYKDSPS